MYDTTEIIINRRMILSLLPSCHSEPAQNLATCFIFPWHRSALSDVPSSRRTLASSLVYCNKTLIYSAPCRNILIHLASRCKPLPHSESHRTPWRFAIHGYIQTYGFCSVLLTLRPIASCQYSLFGTNKPYKALLRLQSILLPLSVLGVSRHNVIVRATVCSLPCYLPMPSLSAKYPHLSQTLLQ